MKKEIYCRIWIKEGHQDLTKDEWINFDINKLYRLDGPAYEGVDGTNYWSVDGKWHRLDGPAYEGANGTKEWWIDDKRHRLDGPAAEYSDGSKRWYIDGKKLPNNEIEPWIEETKIDLKTPEGQMAFKLKFL